MADKMLIDASHEEETRVVVVRGNRIEEFDFESQHKKQIRGNIYLAKVTRVEPSLQAAFVDYGGNRHGFLAFAEIHPDYYQIPLADRQALLRAEAEEHRKENDVEGDEPVSADPAYQDQPDIGIPSNEELAATDAPVEAVETVTEVAVVDAEAEVAEEAPKAKPKRVRKPRAKKAAAGDEAAASDDSAGDDDASGGTIAAMVEMDEISEEAGRRRGRDDDGDDDDDDHIEEKEEIESVGAEDAMEEVPDRIQRKPRKLYRIQEVIKRRQILLVQVAKEERGNKGAALTTYLSLAGRYSVLMPNTARGGGISRKITNPADRKRLKEIARGLEVPQGMGVILRTAGANRTKVEIKRDFEYLMRLWENVRTLTLASTAPCLVYEEGSLIKRSIRDLYNKDISEIVVSGEEGYREAKDFMKMLMPSHAKVVQPYRDLHPIFARSGIEAQLDRMLQPQVTLKSGGYIIINQTEALVSIDVNSGRSTREYSIEDTALQTNLEAAEEVARQLRLRDLAGLIVIDFIDMEEKRNNRSVEKKLKDCLKNDRARIQVGRISHFGLLEMSRQRIRASVLESTTQVCPHCQGTGLIRSQSSVALHVLRGIEEFLLKSTTHDIIVHSTPETALYLLNQKRGTIVDYEQRFGVSIVVEADHADHSGSQHFTIERGEAVPNPVKIESLMSLLPEPEEDEYVPEPEDEDDEELVAAPVAATASPQADASANGDEQGNRKRKRRRRRRGKNGPNGETNGAQASGMEDDGDEDEGDEADDDAAEGGSEAVAGDVDANGDDSQKRKRRRRGKRGGRRNRPGEEGSLEAGDENGEDGDDGEETDGVTETAAEMADERVVETSPSMAAVEATEEAPAVPAPKARRTRKAKVAPETAEPAVAEAAPAVVVAEPVVTEILEPAVAEAVEPVAAPIAAPAETPVADVVAEEAVVDESKPARANRESNVTSSQPVVTSVNASDENGEAAKPKKGGWWQKRGFF
ncbi:ribonuclease, Rne/Rng family [Rhizobium sp. PDO1-076]|uniref:Rne/Rng family ribonuclease n=1 Tax=Rhizobium sp. PDO1-076 TaxID=1125979 RepID=UPI00024E2CD7|nr:ribonuclease E/G [Rhizobium sp. PDO1-076]EHS52324.1 ribonuclease, Rne/Rng family [Rhizobium sp. PDO1-076]